MVARMTTKRVDSKKRKLAAAGGGSPRRAKKLWLPDTIISGGQTGVDRAALDAAMELAIPHGGWCPAGRRAEDGRIAEKYQLQETDSPDYEVRTRRNVADSDGTLILHRGPLRGGTRLTKYAAQHAGKPCLCIDLDAPPAVSAIRRWAIDNNVRILNVAGPRESQSPGIAAAAREVLLELWGESPNSKRKRGESN